MNLLAAEFEGMDGGKGSFTVEGRRLRLDVDPAVGRLARGQVTLGIRPRAFVPQEPSSSDTLAGQAELIEPMGAENSRPRPDRGRARHPGCRTARGPGAGRRDALSQDRCAPDPRIRRRRERGAAMSERSERQLEAGGAPRRRHESAHGRAPRIRDHWPRHSRAGAHFPAFQPVPVRDWLRVGGPGGARQQPAAAVPARRGVALRRDRGARHRHDLLHRAAGVDRRGASVWGACSSTPSRPTRAFPSIVSRSFGALPP